VLISINQLTKYWNIKPKNILHVGAHEAEEFEEYIGNGWGPVTWVEVQPEKVKFLREKLKNTDHSVIQAAVWNESGVTQNLKIMSNSQSSSLLPLGTHQIRYPSIVIEKEFSVKTITLDELVKGQRFEYISLDIQGAELNALKGFSNGIKSVLWVYCEVNKEHLYEGCCLIQDIDEYLSKFNFKRVSTRWTENFWGDALYVSQKISYSQSFSQRIQWNFKQLIYTITLSAKKNTKYLLKKLSS
jgi:FkbM family methyltransferase